MLRSANGPEGSPGHEHYVSLFLRHNTPYPSSETNDSNMVNRQSGGEKLKYIFKLQIEVHIT